MGSQTMAVALPRDLRQDASLAKRRHAELCRQKRVFNARNRIIGGDTEAWDVQVHDQKIKEATEKARHETFALKKDLPARQSDNDVRNTVSGMQKFMGEDLNFHERKKFQEEQNREWSLQQQREWKNARAEQKCAEALYTETRLQFDETAKHLQKLESTTRKAVCASVKDFNKSQAIKSVERKKQEKKQEQEDNLAEITSVLRGDLLSENPQQAASSFGPHRVVPDRWKGMTQEQLEQIRLVQKQQIQEKLRLREEKRQRDLDWDRRRIQGACATLLFERQQWRQQRDLRRALDSSNLSLAKEQRLQKKYMNEVYTNQPTGDYFTQFNTGSR
ncbi:RIB43A-like with coiled-coils protein 2 isoform X2 [Gorilla gorilla gorilla]|uniref:RIB43A-like with coiled-coils protein 2 isoform X2 n=1 Tax=Gorilla gorilla gorilla TaxID=9595 RepID=UPI0030090123